MGDGKGDLCGLKNVKAPQKTTGFWMFSMGKQHILLDVSSKILFWGVFEKYHLPDVPMASHIDKGIFLDFC